MWAEADEFSSREHLGRRIRGATDGEIRLSKQNQTNRSPSRSQTAESTSDYGRSQTAESTPDYSRSQTAESTPDDDYHAIAHAGGYQNQPIEGHDGHFPMTATAPLPTPVVTKTSLQRGTMAITPQRPLLRFSR